MIPDDVVEGIPIIQAVRLAEEEFAHPVFTGQGNVCSEDPAFFQDLAQIVEDLGIPDVVVVVGVHRFDLGLIISGVYFIGAVFRHQHPGFFLGGFIIFLHL